MIVMLVMLWLSWTGWTALNQLNKVILTQRWTKLTARELNISATSDDNKPSGPQKHRARKTHTSSSITNSVRTNGRYM